MEYIILCVIAFIGYASSQSTSYEDHTFATCTETWKNNQGFYSQERDGVRYYTHCYFPNPQFNPATCGIYFDSIESQAICDPANILPDSTRSAIDKQIVELHKRTPSICTTARGEKQSVNMMVVALPHIEIPNMSSLNETCQNSCGEIYPTLDESLRDATQGERELAVQNFADGLQQTWETTSCGNLVILVYWKSNFVNESLLATSVGGNVTSYLKQSFVDNVEEKAIELLNDGRTEDAIIYVIDMYSKPLQGFPPALILLVVNCGLLLIVLAFLCVQFNHSSESDYWDEGYAKIITSKIMHILLGGLIIEWLIRGLILLQEKMRWWVVLFPLAGFAASIFAVVYIEVINPDAADNITISGALNSI